MANWVPQLLPVPQGVGQTGQAFADSKLGGVLIANPGGLAEWTPSGIRWIRKGAPVRAVLRNASDLSIWIAEGEGVTCVKDGAATVFGAPQGVERDQWESIARTHDGSIWVRSRKTVRRLAGDSESRFVDPFPGWRFDSFRFSRIVVDSRGAVLMGTRDGFAECDASGRSSPPCRMHGRREGLIAEVSDVVEDRDSLWLSVSGAGVQRQFGRGVWENFDQSEGLDYSSIWGVIPSSPETVWVGTRGGLYRGTRSGGLLKFAMERDTGSDIIRTMRMDRDGALWLAFSPHGLARYDPRSRRYEADWRGLPSGQRIRSLLLDSKGRLWASAGPMGLLLLDSPSRQFRPVEIPVPPKEALLLREDAAGDIWMTSRNGPFRLRGDRWLHYSMRDNLLDDSTFAIAVPEARFSPAIPSNEVWLAYFSSLGFTKLVTDGDRLARVDHFRRAMGRSKPLPIF